MILQDDCYGHRYSRPRTSRANLSTIVERPERIHASILGLATAYVRLGGRYADSHVPPHPKSDHSLFPPPFRIHKTTRRLPLRSPAATAIHGTQWMSELATMCDAAESRLAIGGKELVRPDGTRPANGNNNIEKPKLHEGDLYLCSGSLNALEGALGGVCEGVDAVFKEKGSKRAFVCIRPPGHHCSADMPSGFCWLNNVHVGIGHAVLTHGLTHAAILDFDLHHGDGSQAITWAHNSRVSSMAKNIPISRKTAIGYFSLHDINSYPCEMGDDDKVRNASLCIENAHGQSIWNVHLQSWKTEAEFWELYESRYSVVLTKARNFLRLHSEKLRQAPTHPKPKAAIFLSAGFDASEWESPGMQRHQVNVPTDFYARLTRDVVSMAEEEGLGPDGRVISVLEGGYSDRALMSGVLSHISGLAGPPDPSLQRGPSNGLGQEMNRKLGRDNVNNGLAQSTFSENKGSTQSVDSDWWSLSRLEEIEALVNPQVFATVPKKQRSDARPTYTSATKSFTAKIVSPPAGRRSVSGPGADVHQSPRARPPTPPPPDVDWVTAAHELSKLLIPSARETRSCKPEELNAEASRVRRDRYSAVGLPTPTMEAPVIDPKRMQLRDRKGKLPSYTSEDEEVKVPTRRNRRKTVADVSLLADDAENPVVQSNHSGPELPIRHNRRRSSIASNASSVMIGKDSDLSLDPVSGLPSKGVTLPAKKPRAPTNARLSAAKPKAIKGHSQTSRSVSISSTAPIPENSEVAASTRTEAVKEPLTENEEMRNKDVEQLASGMRTMSIKLNVRPRDESSPNETKSKPAARAKSARNPPSKVAKTASPSKPKANATKTLSSSQPRTADITVIEHQATLPLPPGSAQEGQMVPSQVLEPNSPAAASDKSAKAPVAPLAPEDQIGLVVDHSARMPVNSTAPVIDEKNKVETPKTASHPFASFQYDQPGVNPPATPVTAKRIKQDLPVFTSTSPIVFGSQRTIDAVIDNNVDHHMGSRAHALPSDVQNRDGQLSDDTGRENLTPRQNAIPGEQQSKPIFPFSKEAISTFDTQSSASIWDVPDTPQPHKT